MAPDGTIRPSPSANVVNCTEFQKLHSELRDGRRVDRGVERRLEHHRRHCQQCERRIELTDRALDAWRDVDVIAPSPGFSQRLRRRLLAEVSIGDPVVPTHAGLAAAFLLAAAVGVFLFEGLRGPAEEPAAVAALDELPGFADSTVDVPPSELADVTIPPFSPNRFEFSSSQEPLGTNVVFAR